MNYLYFWLSINKLLRNLTPLWQHVLLLYEVEVVGGDECAVVEVEGFGENVPGASFVTAALADFPTDLRIDLHFCFRSAAACRT